MPEGACEGMKEKLILGAKYRFCTHTMTLISMADDKAYFDIPRPHGFVINGENGLVGFSVEYAKTFKKL